MIRDDIAAARAIVQEAYDLATQRQWSADDQYGTGYRQGVFDLACQLLWPDEDGHKQRERLSNLFAAHKALFVEVP